MPLISSSSYQPPRYLFNGHLQTIVPSLLRTGPSVRYQRERVETEDGDFLDLDWSRLPASQPASDTLGIVSHGLEGSAGRPYMRGMVQAFNQAGFDALAWNYRSCSGEMNRLLRSYHLGDTGDLDFVVRHALSKLRYRRIFLTGFSAGGNVTLKYLGENPDRVPREVKRAAVFSVPTDLKSSSNHISRFENRLYLNNFMRTLRNKIRQKAEILPGQVDVSNLDELRFFPEFDDKYTAPMHGFKSAEEYYEHASSGRYLGNIRIPTLLVNAENDPFLPPACFPREVASQSQFVYLETPHEGGHVGFAEGSPDGSYYSERRALEFLTAQTPR